MRGKRSFSFLVRGRLLVRGLGGGRNAWPNAWSISVEFAQCVNPRADMRAEADEPVYILCPVRARAQCLITARLPCTDSVGERVATSDKWDY